MTVAEQIDERLQRLAAYCEKRAQLMPRVPGADVYTRNTRGERAQRMGTAAQLVASGGVFCVLEFNDRGGRLGRRACFDHIQALEDAEDVNAIAELHIPEAGIILAFPEAACGS